SYGLPVLVVATDPKGKELEYYCFDRFRLPAGLTDADFDPTYETRRSPACHPDRLRGFVGSRNPPRPANWSCTPGRIRCTIYTLRPDRRTPVGPAPTLHSAEAKGPSAGSFGFVPVRRHGARRPEPRGGERHGQRTPARDRQPAG